MSTVDGLLLEPREGFACRDGRGWSAAGRAHALDLPWPSTIRGALRTAYGRELEGRDGRPFTKTEWVDRTDGVRLKTTLLVHKQRDGDRWERFWPKPADAVGYEDGELHRLDLRPPELPTLGRDDDPAREGLWRPRLSDPRKPVKLPALWPDGAFCDWLVGKPVLRSALDATPTLARRTQTHVGIDPATLTAREEILFSENVVETFGRHGRWAFALEVELPDPVALEHATLGGDRRLAELAPVDRGLFEQPGELLAAFAGGSKGLRLVLVTPARFEAGWLPDGFEAKDGEYRGTLPEIVGELVLRAAFVDRPIAVSGWDLAAGAPKRTDRMVPPGSVYFLERQDGAPFDEADARALWLAAIGGRTEDGFGRIVPGVWDPERTA